MKLRNASIFCLLTGFSIASFAGHLPPRWFYSGHIYASQNKESFSPQAENVRTLERGAGIQSGDVKAKAEATLSNPNRIALMLIEDGKVVFEGYNNEAGKDNTLLSYSVAKSMTSLAIGEALCAGKIASLSDSVDKYLPEFKGNNYGSASIKDLLHMASGVIGDEAIDSPAYDMPYKAFGRELFQQKTSLIDVALKYGSAESKYFYPSKRGQFFNYMNLDTSLLGMVIDSATQVSFTQWFGNSVGKRAGLASTFYLVRDMKDAALSFAFFSATLDDYGRIANYVMDSLDGKHGDCLQAYMRDATTDTLNKGNRLGSRWGHNSYGYQFRTDLVDAPKGSFKMQGFDGQHVIFDPTKKRIVLGFSHKWDNDIQDLFILWSKKP
jgi:CubicO group peptidase (beta-lactamase class C family)